MLFRSKGFLPEEKLIECLQMSPFTIVPVGSGEDDRQEITLLSLPSRIPFLVAIANIPIIVLGRKDGAAAKFVLENKLGLVCDYDAVKLSEAVKYICQPENQQKFRSQALKIASTLSADGISDWIWKSLEIGKPIDNRFNYNSKAVQNASVIITNNEVTQKHGTGALVRRIFVHTPNIVSIRFNNHYDGDQIGRAHV